MTTITIAIVDDETIIREQIKNLIHQTTPEAKVDAYPSGESLLSAKQYYDILFLDIQMQGINGLEVAKTLRQQQKESLLIFITGIKEHVFDVFDVTAFHYLLKPIEEQKLKEVLHRAAAEIEKRKRQTQKTLFIQTKTRNITLRQSQILYIESRGKKAEIHTTKEILEIYAVMRELEKQLSTNFYRCHRGYLVNLAYITEYSRDHLTLKNGEDIIMSKEKYSEFIKIYMRYLRNGGTTYV